MKLVKTWKLMALTALTLLLCVPSLIAQTYEYRVLATNRTSSMEEELNETAASGFRLQSAMGGQRFFSGSEVAVIMSRADGETEARYHYRVLAANKTSTLQKELQDAARDGYEYRAQTVFDTAFAGKEVVVILERDLDRSEPPAEYLVLATSRTSTMDKELANAGDQGYEVLGLTVAETAFGGNELVVILRRQAGGR